MDWQDSQHRRICRMRSERHFLLNVKTEKKDDDTVCILAVSGSTGNIYTIQLSNAGLTCDCPDFAGHAKQEEVYCKHCCFIIYRVLNSSLTCMNVRPRKIYNRDIGEWQSKIEQIAQKPLTLLPNVASEDFCAKFQSLSNEKDAVEVDEKSFGIIKQSECKFPERLDDMCAVCYEELKGETKLIECGQCYNLIHKECADYWLRKGTVESCVHCRSLLPYALYLQEAEVVSSKKRKVGGEYKNILE